MSFGWSAGDIWAAIQLLNRIISSVNNIGGSRDNFQELQTELEGLRRALHEISQLASQPGQIPEIVALKFAACLCEDTLKRFFEKIKPFDEALGLGTKVPKLRVAPRMVRWELLVKKDIPEFRCYLVAHVGSLNLRLNTALLKAASTAASRSSQSHIQQLQATELVNEKVTTQSSTIYSKIEKSRETVPRLEQLLGVAGNVWKSQRDLLDMFGKALETLPPPDLRYTWAQAPVKFEDALGRILPVPSEYDWDKLEAIIHAQFKKGPGYDKVRSNEYELYTGTDTMVVDVAPIKFSLFCPFPGMSIKMAFIIGQYAGSERCPRVGCLSKSFSKVGRGQRGRLW
ncbi:hypothetical protein L207DRAFT_445554 [Hyaloscypha variabilis F]|uniref:Ubiquitin-like domain-containing protein n=1 Tax=Hyaloscypha variabilis (strain UAMH 11265 / GT02V1 / F) TaxID=1149755 RepID=A0A2J6QSW5_HYAVF|nr:hypothetical protein L207DRAFT_445554 [Hyaloscypha variabilis F]